MKIPKSLKSMNYISADSISDIYFTNRNNYPAEIQGNLNVVGTITQNGSPVGGGGGGYWTQSGSLIYYNTGNVGINSSSPTERLDVVGNIKASGNVTATNLTGTLQTAAQTNITSTGTLTSLTIGTGDLIVDTDTFFVDSSADKVGINTTTPAISLDIQATDAIQVPSGTTAQRPTAANGMIRYNTTDGNIEGYSGGAWTDLTATGGGSSQWITTGSDIYYNTGDVVIGSTSAATAETSLDISNRTDSILITSGTTAQRPTTPVDGMLRYNTSTNAYEYYKGGSSNTWKTLAVN